ncbi:MAG: acyl-CoA-binding protein [Myxococcota bacterium]
MSVEEKSEEKSEEKFKEAQEKVNGLTQRPSNEELLELYGLYKQGTTGDVSGKRPGMLDMKGRAKYDAWTKQKGTAGDTAKETYVALVDDLIEKYG